VIVSRTYRADAHQRGAGEKRMRQPNAKNCSSVSHVESARKTMPEKKNADRRAELREHAVPSAAIRGRILDREQHGAAPLAAKSEPLTEAARREQHRRGDADRRVGRQQPMHTVESPIVSSAATRVVLRPTRSPKWPKSAEPIGRARNASANVSSEASRAAAGPTPGRTASETQHRRGGIDVEIEELNRGADEAGKEDLRR
jgi:hypothetical protein